MRPGAAVSSRKRRDVLRVRGRADELPPGAVERGREPRRRDVEAGKAVDRALERTRPGGGRQSRRAPSRASARSGVAIDGGLPQDVAGRRRDGSGRQHLDDGGAERRPLRASRSKSGRAGASTSRRSEPSSASATSGKRGIPGQLDAREQRRRRRTAARDCARDPASAGSRRPRPAPERSSTSRRPRAEPTGCARSLPRRPDRSTARSCRAACPTIRQRAPPDAVAVVEPRQRLQDAGAQLGVFARAASVSMRPVTAGDVWICCSTRSAPVVTAGEASTERQHARARRPTRRAPRAHRSRRAAPPDRCWR